MFHLNLKQEVYYYININIYIYCNMQRYMNYAFLSRLLMLISNNKFLVTEKLTKQLEEIQSHPHGPVDDVGQ